MLRIWGAGIAQLGRRVIPVNPLFYRTAVEKAPQICARETNDACQGCLETGGLVAVIRSYCVLENSVIRAPDTLSYVGFRGGFTMSFKALTTVVRREEACDPYALIGARLWCKNGVLR